MPIPGFEKIRIQPWEFREIWEKWDDGWAKMHEDLEMSAWDDVHGGALPMGLVKAARREEIAYMQGRNIWTLRPIRECWELTGKPPVSVRWVDTHKGDSSNMDVRELWPVTSGGWGG